MVMTEWWELRGGFISADVIKWRETIWIPKGPRGRRGKPGGGAGGQRLLKVGARTVCAEVIQGPDEDGWVYLLVRQFDNMGLTDPSKLIYAPPLKVGAEIKRKYKTIMNGDPQRLPWSDESFRSSLASQFLGNKQHERFMSMETDEE